MILLLLFILFLQYQYSNSFNVNHKILSTSISTSYFNLLSPLGHSNSISDSYSHRIKHKTIINPLFATNTKIDTKKSTVNTNDSTDIESNDDNNIGKNAATLSVLAIGVISLAYGIFSGNINFVNILESTVDKVADLGPLGYIYFAAVYVGIIIAFSIFYILL